MRYKTLGLSANDTKGIIFDNGLSLFHYATAADPANLDACATTRTTPYNGGSYEDILCGDAWKGAGGAASAPDRLHLHPPPTANLLEERLCAIETHLQKRVRALLELARSNENVRIYRGGLERRKTKYKIR